MNGENDTRAMRREDIGEALALLTRLPVEATGARGARAAWAWPVAGAVVGLLAGLVGALALWLGLGPAVAAGLALAVQVVATGALHEDGLADCADGFWGGWEVARRLEIMRDSRIGTYGVLALVLAVLLRWSLLAGLFAGGHVLGPLIAAGALSRVPMAAIMHHLPAARGDGLSVGTGRPSHDTVVLAGVVAMLIALIVGGFAALLAAGVGALGAFGLARIAQARIGGQTGDVLGAGQQVAEIGLLIGFAVARG